MRVEHFPTSKCRPFRARKIRISRSLEVPGDRCAPSSAGRDRVERRFARVPRGDRFRRSSCRRAHSRRCAAWRDRRIGPRRGSDGGSARGRRGAGAACAGASRDHRSALSSRTAANARRRDDAGPGEHDATIPSSAVGIGNVETVIVRARGRGPFASAKAFCLRCGVVGYQLPALQSSELPVAAGDLIVFATDGVREDFSDLRQPGRDSRAAGRQDRGPRNSAAPTTVWCSRANTSADREDRNTGRRLVADIRPRSRAYVAREERGGVAARL